MVYSHAQEVVALKDQLDLLDVEVNQHASNLWSFITLKLIYEVVDCGTNLLLVVWVFCGDTLEDW